MVKWALFDRLLHGIRLELDEAGLPELQEDPFAFKCILATKTVEQGWALLRTVYSSRLDRLLPCFAPDSRWGFLTLRVEELPEGQAPETFDPFFLWDTLSMAECVRVLEFFHAGDVSWFSL